MKLHMYTMVVDSGFAPHVKDDLLSLACCAGYTREHTNEKTYVMGVSGSSMKGVKKHLPIYFMEVTNKITFEEYFEDTSYEGRVDNIYKRDGKKYERTIEKSTIYDDRYENEHIKGNDPKKSEHVLLSDDFYYFGNKCNTGGLDKKMKQLCENIGFSYTAGGHYKKVTDEKIIKDLIKYFEKEFDKGNIGEPNHQPAGNCYGCRKSIC